jgi:hypothetical protein
MSDREFVEKPVPVTVQRQQAVANGLPHTVGNRAMTNLMVQREPAKTAGNDLGSMLSRQVLEDLRVTATQTTFLAGAYAERGLNTVDTLRSSLTATSDTYKSAYGTYERVIKAAGKEARDQQDWINIFAGIAIGTGVGLIAGAIVPEGLALGYVILAEAAGEGVEALAAAGAQATGLLDVKGTDLQPGGLDPNVLKSGIWQRLSDLYRSVLGVQRHTMYLPLILGNTEYALGQLRLTEAGAETDMDHAELVDMAAELGRSAAHLRALNAELQQRLAGLDALRAQVAQAKPLSAGEMEQDIWIMWMSELRTGDSDILDLDEIEDHLAAIGVLGEGGLLGVDFGSWTSEDDELEALRAARAKAGAIRERYRALTQ